jgi:hypothetical protein
VGDSYNPRPDITKIACALFSEWSFSFLPRFFLRCFMICITAAAVGRARFRGQAQQGKLRTSRVLHSLQLTYSAENPVGGLAAMASKHSRPSSLFHWPLRKRTGTWPTSGSMTHEASGIYGGAAKQSDPLDARQWWFLWCSRLPNPATSRRGTCAAPC